MYTGYVRNLLIAEDDNNSRAVAVAAGEAGGGGVVLVLLSKKANENGRPCGAVTFQFDQGVTMDCCRPKTVPGYSSTYLI